MKKISINLYRFEELPEGTQQKAVRKLDDINVADSIWYETTFEHFNRL